MKINWIDVLAYLGAKYGGDFKSYKEKDMTEIVEKLQNGEKIEDLTKKCSITAITIRFTVLFWKALQAGIIQKQRMKMVKYQPLRTMVYVCFHQ